MSHDGIPGRPFMKGLELSHRFFVEAVQPILAQRFPELTYSAALLGAGSEVLGFDTPQSEDHDWGPRLMLFLQEADHATRRDQIDGVLRQALPHRFHGYPTGFRHFEDGTTVMSATGGDATQHGVTFFTVDGFFRQVLGFDPLGEIRAADWLSVPENHLLMVTAGRVFHDGLGRLEVVRATLRYYPHDVWLYLLAAQWRRIGQEEAFVGRCGQVGDDLGSRLVAARLVRDLMRLCFLMERQYAPYLKWFATAFARLDCAGPLGPILARVLSGETWQEREQHLSAAYEVVAGMHNRLAITAPLSEQVRPYYTRPFLVIGADRFVDAIRAAITSSEVQALPEHLGGIDQFSDSTDVLNHLQRFRCVYE